MVTNSLAWIPAGDCLYIVPPRKENHPARPGAQLNFEVKQDVEVHHFGRTTTIKNETGRENID